MDIGPTILDYMGIEQPTWMAGGSLIDGLDQDRLIFAASIKNNFVEAGSIGEESIEPPFYQFGYMNIIQCQRFHRIDLQDLMMVTYDITSHTQPCDESVLDSPEEIWNAAGDLLISLGYELTDGWQ